MTGVAATDSPYDEVGTRTRQAWLRTGLGVVAVTLLAVRGMVLAGAGPVLALLPLAPAGCFIAIAVLRVARLGPGPSPGISRPAVLVALAGIQTLAGVALVLVMTGDDA